MLIGFVGSVFSPYYARARARGAADPLAHCAINVALYRDGRPLWAMTERGAAQLQRGPDQLQVGPSALHWDGQVLEAHIHEWAVPWPRRLRGRVRLRPRPCPTAPIDLDAAGRHQWWPLAPLADVEVDFDEPDWHWRGQGYLDSNRGSEPLEQAFSQWHWARAHLDERRCMVVYDTLERDGQTRALALELREGHSVQHLPLMARADLPRGTWGVAQQVRQDAGSTPQRLRRLEDGPFYTRSLLGLRWHGLPVCAVQESLDLRRFARPWVQAMLPFRMPRRA